MPQLKTSCPVCEADLRAHTPETAEDHEEWRYDCGLIVWRIDGKFVAENACLTHTDNAMDRWNCEPPPPAS